MIRQSSTWQVKTKHVVTALVRHTRKRGIALAGLLVILGMSSAHAEKVTYYVADAQGTVVATMNSQAAVTYTAAYRPYGKQAQGAAQTGPGYTGHVNDAATGLVYMQQRYYDPEAGRFLSVDPVVPAPGDVFNFGRYTYANDNPIVNTDPDGRNATAFIGGLFYESWSLVTGNGFHGSQLAGALADGYNGQGESRLSAALQDVGTLSVVTGGVGALRAAGSLAVKEVAAKGETELVQRAMSRAELKAMQETGLVRGGRPGTHYASDSVNSSAGRAQQRLALPNKPEVKITIEVSKGKFSSPARVEPNYNMPGGGMERTATGKIPVLIKRVEELRQ